MLILFFSTASAGAWTQPAGDHYLKVSSRTLIGQDGFFADGQIAPLGVGYVDLSLAVYGELGLHQDWTTLISTTPVGWTDIDGQATPYTGPTLLGIRRALLSDDVRLAAEVRAGGTPPVGDGILAEGTDWQWQAAVPGAQAEGELQIGRGLSRGWVTASAGARWHSALNPALLGAAQIGRSGERLTLSLSLSTVQPLAPITVSNVAGTGQTRYIGFEPGLSLRLNERLSLAAGLGGAVSAQANAAAPSLTFGVEHK